MNTSTDPKQDLVLDFKSATLYALRVVLRTQDTPLLLDALERRMAEAGSFFEHEPVVIDALALDESPDWDALVEQLRGHHLHPIGVSASGQVLADAQAHGLAQVEVSAAQVRASPPPADTPPPPAPTAATRSAPAPAAPPAPPPAAMLIRRPPGWGQPGVSQGPRR
ncbi:MAG: septum site-determining protein MinC, partial [Alcaligenaceae bacterium]|nr:septum site-determining protein MinC [Alcaligenaceae bacterium]